MILTPHAIVGAAVASALSGHPVVGFALAIASHHVLDMIPHSHYEHHHFDLRVVDSLPALSHNIRAVYQLFLILFDFSIGTLLAILVFARDWHTLFITLLGVAGGVLPDFFQFIYFSYKKEPVHSLVRFHSKFETKNNLDHRPFLGAFIQTVTTICIVLIFLSIK
ncbi:MAG: hypothetical protein WC631_01075 [Candidatus Paceibacterota bacterium]|jgi:hypothetical protein